MAGRFKKTNGSSVDWKEFERTLLEPSRHDISNRDVRMLQREIGDRNALRGLDRSGLPIPAERQSRASRAVRRLSERHDPRRHRADDYEVVRMAAKEVAELALGATPLGRAIDIAERVADISAAAPAIANDPQASDGWDGGNIGKHSFYPPQGYSKSTECPGTWYGGNYGNGIWAKTYSGDVFSSICLSGQAWGGAVQMFQNVGNTPFLATGNNITVGDNVTLVLGPRNWTVERYYNKKMFYYPAGSPISSVDIFDRPYVYVPGASGLENANVTRARPAEVLPEPLFHAAASVVGGISAADRARSILAGYTQQALTMPAPRFGRVFPPGGGPPRTVFPKAPEPPGAFERESPKTKGAGAILFAVMDVISERAEIIDAWYDALPKKTKQKWKCNSKRGFIDSAGQYGIDGADCKAVALWHNIHKVDVAQAVKNMIANHIQDKVIGGIQRRLPRNVGRAVDPAMKEVNAILDKFFELSGLSS